MEELHLTRTMITGPFPDKVPFGSHLRIIYAWNLDPNSGKVWKDGGFSGERLAMCYMCMCICAAPIPLPNPTPRHPQHLHAQGISPASTDQIGPCPRSTLPQTPTVHKPPHRTGPFPKSLTNAQYLSDLVMPYHDFAGPIPPLPDSVVWLDLKGNKLTQMPGAPRPAPRMFD